MDLAASLGLCSILSSMNFLKMSSVLMALLAMVSTGAFADEPECVVHSLSQDDVRQRLRHWSGLRPFARWQILSLHLGSCVEDGLLDSSLEISSPESMSRHQVRYILELKIGLDGASGSPDSRTSSVLKDLAAGVRNAIRKAEEISTIRRFIQRFSVRSARLEISAKTDDVIISYEAGRAQTSKPDHVAKLVFDSKVPGGISAVSLPSADSLPVLPHLLRMLEVVSSRYPGCQVGWVDGVQRPAEDPDSGPAWSFSTVLHGEGCPKSCAVSLAPDGGSR